MVHDNSTQSYQEQKANGSTAAWRRKVYDVFFYAPTGSFTDREVMDVYDRPDANLIRPEITRLIQDGLIKEVGKTKCKWTGKTVRHSTVTGKEYFSRGNKKGVLCDR